MKKSRPRSAKPERCSSEGHGETVPKPENNVNLALRILFGFRLVMLAGSVAVAFAMASCDAAKDDAAKPDPGADKAAIVQALDQWPKDFNGKNPAGVCSLFAPDAIVIYPDSPDRSYGDSCTQLTGVLANPDRNFSYAPPDIHEVLVDGDLATVRLIWTLTVTDHTGAVLEIVRENGVDVFARQPDGSWKIRISHAYPL